MTWLPVSAIEWPLISASSALKDRHGNLFPLTTSLKSFHSLGCGVALYMYLVHWWSHFFLAVSLLSFSGLVLDFEGNGMDWSFLNTSTVSAL